MSTLESTSAKRGRPTAIYDMRDGTRVVGLMRLKDGRWRASGPEKYTFTEPDERLAVARFREWQQAKIKTLGKTVVHQGAEAAATDIAGRALDHMVASSAQEGPAGTVAVSDASLRPEQWVWLREQIFDRPQWVAQMVGIEQIAYLDELKKREPSPTLEDVGLVYFGRNDISPKEISKARCYWEELQEVTGVKTLRDLTAETVATYGNKVHAMKLSPKSRYHRFNKVKTVLNNYRTTGRSLDEVRKALDAFAVIRTPETTSLDPHPISRANWDKLYTSQAERPEGKAMLLCALNLCMYPIDLARLQWSELDLDRATYSANRGKTKVAKVAVLWPETVAALQALAKMDDGHVFHKATGRPHTDTTIRKWFYELRDTLKLGKDELQMADIRDGAFTEAVQGKSVQFNHAQILAGHRSGMADHYVRRNPKMVADACEAVRQAYLG